MTKTISVVIPARNRPQFTSEAISSVLKQKLPKGYKIKVVVVDNRSDPPLKQLLHKSFPEVVFINNDKFDSPGGTRNVGLKYVKGDYIAFLDNDDMWKQDFVKNSLNAIKNNVTVGTLCMTAPYYYGEYPFAKRIVLNFLNLIRSLSLLYFYFFNEGVLPKSAFYLGQISHMMFKLDVVKKIKFREKTAAAEDWEFICDTMKTFDIRIVNQKLVNFRYEIRSNTNSQKVKKEKWNSYINLLSRLDNSYKRFPWYQFFLRYIDIFS